MLLWGELCLLSLHEDTVVANSGIFSIATNNGESRRFHPGEVLFCNDLTGKGHVTRALTDLTLAFVNRAKS